MNNNKGVNRFCANFNRYDNENCYDVWTVHDGKTFKFIAEGPENAMKKLTELLTKYGIGTMKGKMI